MIFKKISYRILITIYAIIVLLFALIAFTYAYFHDAKNIDFYQIYESGNIDINITTIPSTINSKIAFYKTPITKINDLAHEGFNDDIILFTVNIHNNSLFAVKPLIELIPNSSDNTLLYWIGDNLLSNNYHELIINDVGLSNIENYELLKSSLEMVNNQTLNNLSQTIIPQNGIINLTFVFWMEWDYKPENLNYIFEYMLKITTIQYNGNFN